MKLSYLDYQPYLIIRLKVFGNSSALILKICQDITPKNVDKVDNSTS